MSELSGEDTINSDVMECPYCGESYQPECENFSEDVREEKCESCGMKYYAHESFSVDHHATPDCELNNIKHDYQLLKGSDGSYYHCCGLCEKLKPYARN